MYSPTDYHTLRHPCVVNLFSAKFRGRQWQLMTSAELPDQPLQSHWNIERRWDQFLADISTRYQPYSIYDHDIGLSTPFFDFPASLYVYGVSTLAPYK